MSFFFFNDTATTEIYTLSLHDALPIFRLPYLVRVRAGPRGRIRGTRGAPTEFRGMRSEEHTSELQSRSDVVCRLLLEKKQSMKTNSPPAPDCDSEALVRAPDPPQATPT